MSTDRGKDKQDVVYIHVCVYTHTQNGIPLRHKNNEIMPSAATWMDLEIITLSEMSQTERSLICGI